jgi:hypothetical protein
MCSKILPQTFCFVLPKIAVLFFPSAVGTPLEVMSLMHAKELAQGELALA